MPKSREPRTKRQQLLSTLAWARLVLLIALPAFLAFAGYIANSKKDQTRTYWILGIVFVALVIAFLNVWEKIQARRAAASAVSAKAALAGSLSQSGKPLVTLLTKVAEAKSSERRAEVKTLISRTVQLCHSQSGKMTHLKCKTRAVLYLFSSTDVLVRQDFDGRDGKAPRLQWNSNTGGPQHKRVIEMAKGEDALLVRDTEGDDVPPDFVPDRGAEYKSFLQVPVRTERRSFGFLSVDSDKAYSLTETDQGFVVLMARLLASALALLNEAYPQLVHHDAQPVPRQSNSTPS